MVFGAHREAFVGGVGARPLGHRPAFEHAIDFEAEVVMEPRRVMLLDDEAIARLTFLALCDLPRGLGGQFEIALGIILGEGVSAGHCCPPWPRPRPRAGGARRSRSEEHTSELQSLMRIS